MKLIVGCPVYERAWVLDAWFDALEDWRDHADITFFFVYTDSLDETREVIEDRAWKKIVFTFNDGNHSTKRNWGDRTRLETLAEMRNFLIAQVNLDSPDFFLSLDSDILVAPWEQSQALFDTQYDAVAPLVYLGSGDISNAFNFHGDHHRRITESRRYGTDQRVDVIAAAKLMKPRAYQVSEYGYDRYGEDFYWAREMRRNGVQLGLNSSVVFKHIMERGQLDKVDRRLGW